MIPTLDGTPVPPWRGNNYKTATELHVDNIQAQFEKFLASGVVEEVTDPASIADLVVNPVGAADKKDNGVVQPERRWYLDLSRAVNARLPHYEMRFPGYDNALDRLSKGCFMAKVDLSAAFLHVHVHRHSHRLLGFSWRGKFYQFTRMIFGLSIAPAVWQYVTERVCDLFRSLGFVVLIYLDDFLLIADSKDECQRQLDHMLS